MNQELWNAFLNGQIMIRIDSNRQASEICNMAMSARPDIEEAPSWNYDDFLHFPFVVVESAEDDVIFLNGTCRPVRKGKEYSFATYAELLAEDEPQPSNVDLEGIL